MNKFDKKYKQSLEERSFPDALKQKGWNALQSSLDQEFPVASPRSGIAPWKMGLGLLVAVLVGGALWLMMEESEFTTTEKYQPRNHAQKAQLISEIQYWDDLQPAALVSPAAGSSGEGFYQSSMNNPVKIETPASSKENGEVGQETITNTAAQPVKPAIETQTSQGVTYQGSTAIVDSKESQNVASGTNSGLSQEDQTTVQKAVTESSKTNEDAPQDITQANQPEKTKVTAGIEKLTSQTAELKTPDATEDGNTQEKVSDPDSDSNSKDALSLSAAEVADVDSNQPTDTDSERLSVASWASSKDSSQESLSDAPSFNKTFKADTIASESIETMETENQPDEEGNSIKKREQDWHLAFPDPEATTPLTVPTLSGKRFALSVYGGYNYVGKSLSSEDATYLDRRKNEEKPIWAIATGVEIDYFLNSKLTFTTGVGYAQYGEELDYASRQRDTAFIDGRYTNPRSFPNIQSIDSTRVIDSIFVGHWNYHVIYDKEDSTIIANNGTTSITYIEIPLLLGYRLGDGWLRPWAQAGVSMGLPITESPRYIRTNGEGLAEGGQNLAPLQWSGLMHLGIDAKISRHWSLRVQGMGSLQLNSILNDDRAGQRYYRLGGRIGLAYNF